MICFVLGAMAVSFVCAVGAVVGFWVWNDFYRGD